MTRDKNIRGNSANYIAVSGMLFLEEVILGNLESGDGYFGFVGPVYGLQRTYFFNIEFGYYFGSFFDDSGIGPTFSFSIGWVIVRKRTNSLAANLL